MSEQMQFRLPDVGEGLTEADIVSWHVKPGDPVTVNQVIVEIETAKAVVELPCPFEGVVAELFVEEGQTVDVGTPIIAVDVAGAAAPAQSSGAGATASARPVGATAPRAARPSGGTAGGSAGTGQDGPGPEEAGAASAGEQRQPVLVGYGVKPGTTTRRRRKTMAVSPAANPPAPAPAATPPALAPAASMTTPAPTAPAPATVTPVKSVPAAMTVRAHDGGGRALAKPPVRKLARDLSVDLSELSGTGPQGSITRDDIQHAVEGRARIRPAEMGDGTASGGAAAAQPAPDRAARPGVPREERIPVRGVRKHTAEAMVTSAFTAPHVTEFLDVDVTQTTEALRLVRELPEFAGVRVSPLLFVARALLVAVARHPMINSTWDDGAQEIIVRNYVNGGVAAPTQRGLLVPNIKDAHAQALPELARALADLAATARDGRCTPADLTGGTITVTNVGVFGVDAGTPILTPGEAAILAFGRIRDAAWVHDGELAVRKVTTLSLSFDHRIVDGELGSAVLRDVGQMLEDPVRVLAWA
ncbi:MAG: dihydrolipoamide acetyltransferase family protein [Streptosporangiaceae bacterium]